VFAVLTRTLRLAATRWPPLLAWFLAGWILHFLAIRFAATVGAIDGFYGLLVLPVAVLARLGSYVAMLMVLRDALPAYSRIRERGSVTADGRAPGEERGPADLAAAAILPFFTFYAAWKFLRADVQEYAVNALARINWFDPANERHLFDIGDGPLVFGVIVAAYLLRLLIKRNRDKLPVWTSIVATYLEALWIFLTIYKLAALIPSVPSWVSSRQIMHTISDAKASFFAQFEPVRVVWEAVTSPLLWVTGHLSSVVLLPIAWLTIAGVVYGRALENPPPQNKTYVAATNKWAAVPTPVRDRVGEITADFRGRWRPLLNAFRLILRAGLRPMAVFVLAYTALEAAQAWLFIAVKELIGPQPLSWWFGADEPIGFVVALVIEPLRICLLAAAYDFCLDQLDRRASLTNAVSTAT
jgi:hypothetical protein